MIIKHIHEFKDIDFKLALAYFSDQKAPMIHMKHSGNILPVRDQHSKILVPLFKKWL